MRSIDHKRGREPGYHHSEEAKQFLAQRARLQGAIRRGYRGYAELSYR
jgi:hypothetical protein